MADGGTSNGWAALVAFFTFLGTVCAGFFPGYWTLKAARDKARADAAKLEEESAHRKHKENGHEHHKHSND